MLSFTKGKPISNIYKNKEDAELITKLKINPTFGAIPKEEIVSNKDKNLVIKNNVFDVPDGYTQRLAPDHDKDQNLRILVCAPSGSGKSTWVKNFILDYKKKYPSKMVFLFSRHDSDPSIDDANPTRIKITEEEVAMSLKSKQPLFENVHLAHSLVIFDDTYSAQSKLLVDFWDSLASDLAQNARKLEIDLIFVIHNTNFSRTRFLMSEASMYVFFLRSGSRAMYTRLLTEYIGIKDKKVLKKLFNLPSRYVIFSNIAPLYIMCEKQVFTFDYLEEDYE